MGVNTASSIKSGTQISKEITLTADSERFAIFLAASIADRSKRKESLRGLTASKWANRGPGFNAKERDPYPASACIDIAPRKASCSDMLAVRSYSLDNMPTMSKKQGGAPFGRAATAKNAFMVLFYIWKKKRTSAPELTLFCARDYSKIHCGSLFDYVFGLDVELVLYSDNYRIGRSLIQLKTSHINEEFKDKDNDTLTMKLFSGIKDFSGYAEVMTESPLKIVMRREVTGGELNLQLVSGCALSAYPVIDDMVYARHIDSSWYPSGKNGAAILKDLKFHDIVQTVPLGKLVSCNSFNNGKDSEAFTEEIESFPQLMIANYHGISYLVRVPLSFLENCGAMESHADTEELEEFSASLIPTLQVNSEEVLNFFNGDTYSYSQFFRR